MNLNPIDFTYIDGENIYPIQEYVDEKLNDIILGDTNINNLNIGGNYIYSSNEIVANNNTLSLVMSNAYPFGEIKFKTYNEEKEKIKIDYIGKLKVYHNYNILQPLFAEGWYDVEDEILQLKADGINTDGQLSILEAGAIFLQGEIDTLVQGANNIEGRLNTLTNTIVQGSSYEQIQQTLFESSLNNLAFDYNSLMLNITNNAQSIFNERLGEGLIYGTAFMLGGAILSSISSGFEYKMSSNALYKNSNFTETQKDNIFNKNYSNNLSNISNYNFASSNLHLNFGFINSNNASQQLISNLNTYDLYIKGVNVSNNIYVNSNNFYNQFNNTSNIFLQKNGDSMYNTLAFQKSTSGIPLAGYFGGNGLGDRIIYQPSTTPTDYPCSIGINNTDKTMWYSLSSNYSNAYYFGGVKTLDIGSNTINFNGLINASNLTSNNITIPTITQTTILNDTPNVNKKKGFLINVSTPCYVNQGNTLYYSYDIYLPSYISSGIIENTNDPYRIFKIRIMPAVGYFEYLPNGIPDCQSYEIFMSYKQYGAVVGVGKQGLNICCLTSPQNYYLDKIMPNTFFLMRNVSASFNHISVISTKVIDLRVIIEDLLN